MTTFILMLWTVVAAGSAGRVYTDWRPMGEFTSAAACVEAARQMNALDRYRCVAKAEQKP